MARSIFLLRKRQAALVWAACLTLTFCFTLINAVSFSQEKKLKIYPTAGITWRSTAMNFFNLKAVIPADPTKPFPYEKNVQGISINTGLELGLGAIAFEYYPNLRYDVTQSRLETENDYVKEFLIDHNFSFIIKHNLEYGIGFSIINSGKGYYFVNPVLRYHDIEFKTYNVFVTVPIKKFIHLEIKALYVPEGFPYNPNEKYIMYSLRAYYRFNFLNKSKKNKSD